MPVSVPEGTAASSEELRLALGRACSAHLVASSPGGLRQQAGSGHDDTWRCLVSRPRNHFTLAKGVPTLTEKAPWWVVWMLEVHQYVPAGLSVYWWYGLKRSSTSNTCRALHRRHTTCPSMAPRASVGKAALSFS